MQPRRFAHRGVVAASGVAISTALVPEPDARRRVLALWDATTHVARHGSWIVVVFGAPRYVACSAAAGAPLVHKGAALSAVPLDDREYAALALSHVAKRASHVVLAIGGDVQAWRIADLDVVDPADWIDVGAWTCADGEALGEDTPRIVSVAPDAVDVRAELGIGEAPPEQRETLRALASETATPRRASKPGLWTRLATWLRERGIGDDDDSPAAIQPYGRVGLLRRMMSWVHTRITLPLFGTWVGTAHARYLHALEQMFQRGELDEALRRALPTTARERAGQGTVSLSLPGRRDNLDYKLERPTGAPNTFLMGGNWFDRLRQTYRSALTKLVAQERYSEAAYVLIELLDEPDEAIALLERNQQYEEAAKLAEGHQLAPGIAVRLWLLAGNSERAILLARTKGAFADAIARLQHSHRAEADKLRLVWAHESAQAGNYTAAVDIAWPVNEANELVASWMQRAIDAGGRAGAAMLPRLLVRDPDAFDQVLARAQAIADEPTARQTRLALAEGLAQHQTPGARIIARPTLRAIFRDAGEHADPVTLRALRRLANVEAGLLHADLPDLPAERTRSSTPRVHAVGADDTGALRIIEAVALEDERTLLALGELGVAVLNRRGRVVHRFESPCDALVVADSGLRALALRKRGDNTVIHRLDLESRRSVLWGEAPLRCFARAFDAGRWFAATEDALHAFDVQSPQLRSLWSVSDLDITGIECAANQLVCMGWGGEWWQWELPSLTLRERRPLEINGVLFAWAADGRTATLVPKGETADGMEHDFCINSSSGSVVLVSSEVGKPHYFTGGVAIHSHTALSLYEGSALRLRVELPGQAEGLVHIRGDRLAYADDHGRLLVVDLETFEVCADWRPALR